MFGSLLATQAVSAYNGDLLPYLQAFNTFIDDVFAFIITMPTSHRLAVFRDDLVFIVYLYQRWWVGYVMSYDCTVLSCDPMCP